MLKIYFIKNLFYPSKGSDSEILDSDRDFIKKLEL